MPKRAAELFKTLAEARAHAGSLGEPSKMPGMAYGLPAAFCNVGSKLAKKEGTTCSECYALKGRYVMPCVLKAQRNRAYLACFDPLWEDAMVYLIDHVPAARRGYFRWHDSGDLQSVTHLARIANIARRLPDIKFWLPTREYQVLRQFLRLGAVPKNLIIRLSAPMIDGQPPTASYPTTSGVHSKKPAIGWKCPAAEKYGNTCGPCRACWNPKVAHVSYPLH